MFRRILIPVTRETLSQRAAHEALQLAKVLEASVVFTYVLSEYTSREVGEEILAPWAETAHELGLAFDLYLANGYITGLGEAIVAAAEDHECDLIVMGTHGREGINRLLMGSVAERVLRLANIPVMLSRSPAIARHFEQIVVPLDGSKPSHDALVLALTLAQKLKAKLHLLHVTPDVPLPPLDPAGVYGLMDYSEVIVALDSEAKTIIADALAFSQQFDRGLDFTTTILPPPRGRLFDRIAGFAEEIKADLLVMGTHGRTGIDRWLLGSIAEGVAHRSTLPVLLLHG
jgi:nucleotide-binding universal stress UspA family protein